MPAISTIRICRTPQRSPESGKALPLILRSFPITRGAIEALGSTYQSLWSRQLALAVIVFILQRFFWACRLCRNRRVSTVRSSLDSSDAARSTAGQGFLFFHGWLPQQLWATNSLEV